jgi:hypothetical protein
MKAGGDALTQAQAAQKAFRQTLVCSPIERTGDTYTIRADKPAAFQVILEKADKRVKTRCDNTKTKTITDEAERLFGQRCTVEQLPEPGFVYTIKPPHARASQAKPNWTSSGS